MPKVKDIVGVKFNRLTVLSVSHRDNRRKYHWHCRCECGKEIVVLGSHLVSGHTRSCGCLLNEIMSKRGTHRETGRTKEYRTWNHMIRRCHTLTDSRYQDYGGRGIMVCDHWRGSFENFLRDMGRAPSPKHSIERMDNNAGYSPENCRWATQIEQANNQRNNTRVEYMGKIKTIAQWARELGLDAALIAPRLRRGWSAVDAFTTPVLKIRRSRGYFLRQIQPPKTGEQEPSQA